MATLISATFDTIEIFFLSILEAIDDSACLLTIQVQARRGLPKHGSLPSSEAKGQTATRRKPKTLRKPKIPAVASLREDRLCNAWLGSLGLNGTQIPLRIPPKLLLPVSWIVDGKSHFREIRRRMR